VKVKSLFFLILSLVVSLWSDEKYQPGEGWKFSKYPLYLGGYFSVMGSKSEKSEVLKVDETALMLYGEFDRYSFFSELEMWEPYAKRFGEMGDEKVQTRVFIERLFFTYYIDDNSEIMVGKLFSQIGFWNTFAINVLRDTTSDPNFIENIFPEMTTGVVYSRFFDSVLLQTTLQHNPGLDDQYNNFKTDRHYALALTFDNGVREWKTGLGWFEERKGDNSFYATLGYRRFFSDITVMAESAVRKSNENDKLYYDIYAQGVWHYKPRHDLVLRIEEYKDSTAPKREREAVVGYTYRPHHYMAVKCEYDIYEKRADRWLISFSMMF